MSLRPARSVRAPVRRSSWPRAWPISTTAPNCWIRHSALLRLGDATPACGLRPAPRLRRSRVGHDGAEVDGPRCPAPTATWFGASATRRAWAAPPTRCAAPCWHSVLDLPSAQRRAPSMPVLCPGDGRCHRRPTALGVRHSPRGRTLGVRAVCPRFGDSVNQSLGKCVKPIAASVPLQVKGFS